MNYRRLGNSELVVSELGLGSWLTYGVSLQRDEADACLRQALELGINFVDTANMYGRGAAESLLGELLSAFRRDDYVLATKAYFPMSDTDRGLSRAQIEKQIDASLKRLRTDHVDLFQAHRYDADTPLEETMRALHDVVKAGKARYIGFSQWSPRQIKAAAAIDGAVPFVSSQPQYSLLHRRPERKIFPLCQRLGIGQIVYSPLAQGVLTGKYRPGEAPPGDSRAANRRGARKMRRFTDSEVVERVAMLRPIARELSLSMSQLALSWVLTNPCVSAALIGATRPGQIVENAGAVGVRLDAATLQKLDQLLEPVIRR